MLAAAPPLPLCAIRAAASGRVADARGGELHAVGERVEREQVVQDRVAGVRGRQGDLLRIEADGALNRVEPDFDVEGVVGLVILGRLFARAPEEAPPSGAYLFLASFIRKQKAVHI